MPNTFHYNHDTKHVISITRSGQYHVPCHAPHWSNNILGTAASVPICWWGYFSYSTFTNCCWCQSKIINTSTHATSGNNWTSLRVPLHYHPCLPQPLIMFQFCTCVPMPMGHLPCLHPEHHHPAQAWCSLPLPSQILHPRQQSCLMWLLIRLEAPVALNIHTWMGMLIQSQNPNPDLHIIEYRRKSHKSRWVHEHQQFR